jgi:hypothetical protein
MPTSASATTTIGTRSSSAVATDMGVDFQIWI